CNAPGTPRTLAVLCHDESPSAAFAARGPLPVFIYRFRRQGGLASLIESGATTGEPRFRKADPVP
ncbi:MAG: hypothetical protein K6U88_10875, partial [Dehalococcoidia bacterium]|nr:hypothetical protein [Dehalococcoidia bacterium]